MCPCNLWFRFHFSLLFSPSDCIPLWFLLTSVLLSLSACLPLPLFSPLSPFRSSSFSSCDCGYKSVSFLLLQAPSAFVSFTSTPYNCFLLMRWFSLSHHLDYFPCFGNSAPGFSLDCVRLDLSFSIRLLRLHFL